MGFEILLGALATSVVAAIQDGVAQAVFKIPRPEAACRRTPKAFDKRARPELHLARSGAIGASLRSA
eukprot:12829332-Alexandrium_andersonii.AAC.1